MQRERERKGEKKKKRGVSEEPPLLVCIVKQKNRGYSTV